MAEDIKESVAAATAGLRSEMRALSSRVADVEATSTRQGKTVQHIQTASSTHSSVLFNIQRHIEDLDNRGCRHNIRARGFPVSIEPQILEETVVAFFNNLLERPRDSPLSEWNAFIELYDQNRGPSLGRDLLLDRFSHKRSYHATSEGGGAPLA